MLLISTMLAIMAACMDQPDNVVSPTSVAQKIAADDPTSCASPEAQSLILEIADPDYKAYLQEGGKPAKVDTTSVIAINKDIHEITCSAVLHVPSVINPDGKANLVFKLRPALDEGGGFIGELSDRIAVAGSLAFYMAANRPKEIAQVQEAEVENEPEVQMASSPTMPDFETYPALLSGRSVQLKLGPSDPYWIFRSRIREAWSAEPNFGGAGAVVRWGCGTSCSSGVLIDGETGQVYDLPLGGEDFPETSVEHERGSLLLRATWRDGDECVFEAFHWQYERWVTVPGFPKKASGQCPSLSDNGSD
jgi:hypothetical protein